MPRPKRNRKVLSPPAFDAFLPSGTDSAGKEAIELNLEEYESIRLCDYDLLNHAEACELMHVSRATFARIYESARRKVAKAFVEGRAILIQGGDFKFEEKWWKCHDCGSVFNSPGRKKQKDCALCSSDYIEEYSSSAESYCICVSCGYHKKHTPGHPCREEKCPKCKSRMKKK
ncbi:MAG: DNA-binding protein [Marinilabiliales bacterium]|nr:MAG: DNA-binding protein [Marinilabiliales bacterium]